MSMSIVSHLLNYGFNRRRRHRDGIDLYKDDGPRTTAIQSNHSAGAATTSKEYHPITHSSHHNIISTLQ